MNGIHEVRGSIPLSSTIHFEREMGSEAVVKRFPVGSQIEGFAGPSLHGEGQAL